MLNYIYPNLYFLNFSSSRNINLKILNCVCFNKTGEIVESEKRFNILTFKEITIFFN